MRKIIITFLAFILVLLAFGTSTYAWITLARTGQIESITFIATLGDDLEISLDGETYYTELPVEEFSKIFKKTKLMDVTSLDGKSFSHLKNTVEVRPNREYISAEFYFRTTSTREHVVYLANNISNEVNYEDVEPSEGTFVVSRGVEYRSPFDFQYGEDEVVGAGELRTYYASDALRISIISTIDDVEVVKIFDLSGNEERGYGKPYGAFDFYNKVAKSPIELPTETPTTIYQLSEFDPDGPFSYDDISKILKLDEIQEFDGKQYYAGKIRINIWLEGWDADSFDPVVNDRIKIQLQFKAVRN